MILGDPTLFSSATSRPRTVLPMAERPAGDLDPIAAQHARSAALYNPQSPTHAPEIVRVDAREIRAEQEREQRTGIVRVEQRGHLRPGDRKS